MIKPVTVFAILPILFFGLVSCAPKTGTVPTPAPIIAAQTMNTLAAATDAAATALVSAHANGILSDADFVTSRNVLTVIITTGKSINAELRTSDTAADQKQKIVGIIVAAGVPALTAHLNPTAAAILNTVYANFNVISNVVGGPIL